MTPLGWVLAGLACYRLTLLVHADKITAPLRARLSGWWKKLAGCPWCLSVWLAPPIVASGLAWGDGWGWQLVAGSLAVSGATGFLSVWAQPDPE